MQKNRTLGVILASGFSKRMGQNKLLLHFNNMPICEYVLRAAKLSNLDEVLVISRYSEIEKLAKKYDISYINNQNAHLGQSESIKIGVKYGKDFDAIMFLSADIPYITEKVINSMLNAYNNDILLLKYKEKITNPGVFSKKYFAELLELSGDYGGKKVAFKHNFETLDIDFYNKDIDTLEDYNNL